MRSVTGELKAKEQRRKMLESLVEALQNTGREEAAEFPGRFLQTTPTCSSSSVEIQAIGDEAAQDWDNYIADNPRAALYHRYSWRRIVEQAFGHECCYYLARDSDGKVRGVLPVVNLSSRVFGRFAVSLPYFNYGGALADSQAIMEQLMDRARQDAERQGLQHVEYRSCEAGLSLPSSERKVSMILRLPQQQEALEQALGSKVRAQYKQANRYQPILRLGGGELLDDFYQVFCRAMRDLGTPVYGKSFFESILRHQPEPATLVAVYIGRRPVAAAFLLGFRDMLEIPWAASLRDYNHCNVNMWMYRQILGFAIDAGYRYFDFGRSTIDAGTYRFKKQWGARPLKNHWYYHFPRSGNSGNDALPALNPDNPKFRLAIATWKRLPLFVTNALGPPIVKNLP